jgi:D-alanyl-D-alanine carboxypeptidase
MQSVSSALARIHEIQNRVGVGHDPDGFQAVLDAELAGADGAGASSLQSLDIPVARTYAQPVTIGQLIGGTAARSAVGGVASRTDLDVYLGGTGLETRNGHLRPDELVGVSGGWNGRSGRLAPPAAAAWETMRSAALADGVDLRFVDSYRDWATQDAAHRRHLSGEKNEYVLPAGRSQHGNGLAVDLTNGSLIGPGDPAWQWMQANAADYGWHPISNETWHWEFRGA